MSPNPPAPGTGVDKSAAEYLGAVLGAGGVGGLLFWVVATWTGTPLPGVFGRGTVLALIFVGAIAALIGVYLLTASDLTAMRTYVFAIVCGLAWQPMIDAGRRIATNATVTRQSADVGEKIEKLKTATRSGNQQQIDTAIKEALPAINQALKFGPEVTETSKKQEIANQSKEAIRALQAAAPAAPEASVNGLRDISLTASNSGEPNLAINAVQSLHAIGSTAAQRNDHLVVANVSGSLEAIATQSTDSGVKSAAANSASQIRTIITLH